jgi:hypothetical protein
MKKAQWKQSPRERVFNEDPRDKLNRELSTALAAATEKIERYKDKQAMYEDRLTGANRELDEAGKVRAAYRFLRNKGVVVEHNEEFKHLQGDDMDAFFDVKEVEPFWGGSLSSGLLKQSAFVNDMLNSINTSFDLAYGINTRSAR